MVLNIDLNADYGLHTEDCVSYDEREMSSPRVVVLSKIMRNTNGLLLVIPFAGKPGLLLTFGSPVIVSRFGLNPICLRHTSYSDRCGCLKLVQNVMINGDLHLRSNVKRSISAISNNVEIVDDGAIPDEDLNRLFQNSSSKARPLKIGSPGFPDLDITSYKDFMHKDVHLTLFAKKGCTCIPINNSTGEYSLNSVIKNLYYKFICMYWVINLNFFFFQYRFEFAFFCHP